jgi:hypothetical protein
MKRPVAIREDEQVSHSRNNCWDLCYTDTRFFAVFTKRRGAWFGGRENIDDGIVASHPTPMLSEDVSEVERFEGEEHRLKIRCWM